MASTAVKVTAVGVDKTGGVFSSIASKAKGLGTAFAALGGAAAAGFAVKKIADTAKELGALSDIAMQASSSVEDLDGMSKAFNELGVAGGSIEELTKAFQYMTKTTGETGAEGFEKVVNSISKLGTAQERAQAAQAAFGRSGLQYLPLIEAAAENGSTSILEMARSYSVVSQSAADNGDAVADSMAAVTGAVSAMWKNMVGEICGWLDSQFDGGIREAAHRATLEFSAFMKNFKNAFFEWGDFICNAIGNIATFIGETLAAAFTDGTVSEAWENFKSSMKVDWADMQLITDDDRKDIEKKMAAWREGIAKGAKSAAFDPDALAASAKRGGAGGGAGGNAWINAGSYAAATAGLRSQEDAALKAAKKTASEIEQVRKLLQGGIDVNTEAQTVEVNS